MLFRTASAGIGHDVNRIDDAFLVLLLESLEHLLGDFLGDVAPNGNHFVVTLAIGDGAIEILLLHLDDFAFGSFDKRCLVTRNKHVLDSNGDARTCGVEEPEFLEMIESLNSALETKSQIAVVNQLLNSFFLQQTIDEGHFLGQVIVENNAPRSR